MRAMGYCERCNWRRKFFRIYRNVLTVCVDQVFHGAFLDIGFEVTAGYGGRSQQLSDARLPVLGGTGDQRVWMEAQLLSELEGLIHLTQSVRKFGSGLRVPRWAISLGRLNASGVS